MNFSTSLGSFILITGFLYKSYCSFSVTNLTPKTILFSFNVDSSPLLSIIFNSAFVTVSWSWISEFIVFVYLFFAWTFSNPIILFILSTWLITCFENPFPVIAFVFIISNIPALIGFDVTILASVTLSLNITSIFPFALTSESLFKTILFIVI